MPGACVNEPSWRHDFLNEIHILCSDGCCKTGFTSLATIVDQIGSSWTRPYLLCWDLDSLEPLHVQNNIAYSWSDISNQTLVNCMRFELGNTRHHRHWKTADHDGNTAQYQCANQVMSNGMTFKRLYNLERVVSRWICGRLPAGCSLHD